MQKLKSHLIKLLIVLTCVLSPGSTAIAQPFVSDSAGYVSDPVFHTLIKKRGYLLVGAYYKLEEGPFATVARVKTKRKKWKLIDTNGNRVLPESQKGLWWKIKVSRIKHFINFNGDRDISNNSPACGGVYNEEQHPRPYYSDYEMNEQEIDSDYGSVSEFEKCCVNGKCGTIQKGTGKQGLKSVYDQLLFVNRNILKIRKDGKCGLAFSSGKIILNPVYDEILYWNNRNSIVGIVNKRKIGLADITGKIIIAPIYKGIKPIGVNSFLFETDGKSGLLCSDGKIASPAIYDYLDNFSGKYRGPFGTAFLVMKNGKCGLINQDGETLLPIIYHSILVLNEKRIRIEIRDSSSKFGLTDHAFNEILKPIYSDINIGYLDKFISIFVEGKAGKADMNGRIIIPPLFDKIKYAFVHCGTEYFLCLQNGNWSIFNTDENIFTKIGNYDDVIVFQNGFTVIKNDKQGIAEFNGDIRYPVKYDYILTELTAGLMHATLNGKNCIIDRYGNEFIH